MTWEDYHFAELEAEVEAEGRHKRSVVFGLHRGVGLRREGSLSKALQSSEERIILLEGDPGAGKSVALRHVAKHLSSRAGHSWNPRSVIPLYINLKELKRGALDTVDQTFIHDFALASLKRVKSRDVDQFLDEEFNEGIKAGSWLFLFDSFDEIPDVLGATDDADVIDQYSSALYAFLTTFNDVAV